MAYDLNTGKLIEDFAPTLNGAGRSLAVSQDGKTLYVAGEFDKVNNEWHSRLAAFDISHGHGTLISSFQPVFSTTVKDIAVAGDTLYVGGYFTKVNGQPRVRVSPATAISLTVVLNMGLKEEMRVPCPWVRSKAARRLCHSPLTLSNSPAT